MTECDSGTGKKRQEAITGRLELSDALRQRLAESCSNVKASAWTTPTEKDRQSQGLEGGRQNSTARKCRQEPT